MFQLTSMPVLSDVVVIFCSSVVVLIPNCKFWIVALLHSESDVVNYRYIRLHKLQHTGTWMAAAWPSHRPCYRPTVFLFRHVLLIALSFLQRRVRRPLQNTGYTQKNCAVSKVNKKFISHLTRAQRTPSAATTVQVSHALPALRFSCLLRGRGASFQDGVAAGKSFLCAPFWGVQICDCSAVWVSCTV